MKITTIKQEQSFYNPYFFNGKKIDNIVFFKEGQIIAVTNWFKERGSDNDYPSFNLNEEIKLKRKIDFNSKNSFIAKTTEDINTYEANYTLYIKLDNYDYSLLGESLNYETDTHKHYKSKLKISLDSVKRVLSYNKEKDETKSDYIFDNYLISVDYGFRSEKKPKQKKIEKLEKLFNDKNLGLNQWQIKELLNICNLSVKRKK
jgi:hypothetical protein